MKIHILELEPAFELASILSKYIDVNKLDPDKNALEFISETLDKLSPAEYLSCVKLLTNANDTDIEKTNGIVTLAAFVEGLRANQIVSLLEFYKSLGFK